MSVATVEVWDEDSPRDVLINFNPPLKALMVATLDDGTEVDVVADITGFYPMSGDYQFEYTDPECDACGVMDTCKADELDFLTTKQGEVE